MGQKLKTALFLSLAILACFALFLGFRQAARCFAGGGGANLQHPRLSGDGQTITLSIELYRWAAPECLTGKTSDFYANVSCHYRDGSGAFRGKPAILKSESGKTRALYACDVPTSPDITAERRVHYFFSYDDADGAGRVAGHHQLPEEPAAEAVDH